MKNKIMIIMILISVLILITSMFILIRDYMEYQEVKNSNENLMKQAIKQDENTTLEESTIIAKKIDWNKLKQINQDIIGWIEIENTNINYPILKDNNNLYYLKHTFEGKYNRNGSIFTITDYPFEDSETIIYGHNMRNDIMFSELNKYLDISYLSRNSKFLIYTPLYNYQASIFSCYLISEKEEEDNIKNKDYLNRVKYYREMSNYKIETNIEEIKKIVKLSTCSYIGNTTVPTNQRLYIIAKIEKID